MRFRSFPSFMALLLNIQYTIAYVATGFVVSVPFQVIWTVGSENTWGDLLTLQPGKPFYQVAISLISGGVCWLLYLALYPVLRYYDWSSMRLPEFKLFEMTVTRNAALVSLGLLAVAWANGWVHWLRPLWLLFLLLGVAYVKIKAHTLIFREFYAIEQRQHRLEWYDELSHGLRMQATQVGDKVRYQAREVQGQVRARVGRLARWVGVGVAVADEAPVRQRLQVIVPAPCRYQGRWLPGRIVVPPQSVRAAQADVPKDRQPAR